MQGLTCLHSIKKLLQCHVSPSTPARDTSESMRMLLLARLGTFVRLSAEKVKRASTASNQSPCCCGPVVPPVVCLLPLHSMLAASSAPVAVGLLAVAMETTAPSAKALGKRRLDDAVAVSPDSTTQPLAKKSRPLPSQIQQVQKQERRVTRSSLGGAANGSREGSVAESEGAFSLGPSPDDLSGCDEAHNAALSPL